MKIGKTPNISMGAGKHKQRQTQKIKKKILMHTLYTNKKEILKNVIRIN